MHKHKGGRRARRQEGELFFYAMVLSVVASYIILSLKNQDVILFLKEMESDAVSRMLGMLPVFYGFSLLLLAFLVYFASRIRTDGRRHEFGLYLALGMRPGRLFRFMLLEDIRSNGKVIGTGLLLGVFLSEFISVLTAKLLGIGISAHRFRIAWDAVLWSAAGFLVIKLIIFLILSIRVAGSELDQLLFYRNGNKRTKRRKNTLPFLFLGGGMLAYACYLGLGGTVWRYLDQMGLALLLGTAGTISIFFGIRPLVSYAARKQKSPLGTFVLRQLAEFVEERTVSLAVASLFLFLAVSLFGAGMIISSGYQGRQQRSSDYTFEIKEHAEGRTESDKQEGVRKLREALVKTGISEDFSELIPIRIGHSKEDTVIDLSTLLKKTAAFESKSNLPEETRVQLEDLQTILSSQNGMYLIDAEGYDTLERQIGADEIIKSGDAKKDGDVRLYIGPEFEAYGGLLQQILTENIPIRINGENVLLSTRIERLPLTADRKWNILAALVLPERSVLEHTDRSTLIVDGMLSKEKIRKTGLLPLLLKEKEALRGFSFEYESYLNGIGRKLFYQVSASYISLYLALILLVISNTMLGVRFLTELRASEQRYRSLILLGARHSLLQNAVNQQIYWCFGLSVGAALLNGIFGILTIWTGFSGSRDYVSQFKLLGLVILLVGMLEWIYIRLMASYSGSVLKSLYQMKRSE